MAGLKVRLEDGSEVGPMDLDMLQTWYQQGLITGETFVQKAGSPRWVRLSEATELRHWRGPRADVPRARAAGRGAVAGDAGPVEGRWRILLASAFFFVLAAAAFLVALWPDRLRPELDDVPWLRIGLALVVLGLLLVRGWSTGRRIVRIVALLAAGAAFPLAGLFVARGMRGSALLAIASAWLLAAALVAFLAPTLSRLAAAGTLLLLALGAAGLVRFAPAERGSAPAEIAQWSLAQAAFADAEIGLSLTVPRGWVALKPGNPIVAAPEHTRLMLAQPRLAAYALLLVEPPPPRVAILEHYLDSVIARRRVTAASYEEGWRRDGRLGTVASRRASCLRGAAETRVVERTVVAQDGDRYFALVAWAPESAGGRALEEIDALEAAITLSGARDAGRRAAVQQANLELPHLSLATIERLVASGGPASPAELFRRGAAASSRGLASLAPSEAQELSTLSALAMTGLAAGERSQLADYLRRVAGGQPTAADEDERMRLLMKASVTRLGAAQRARLESLHERAVAAALEGT